MTRPCVRCGRRPRQRDTYLCDPCRDDPKTTREARAGERVAIRAHDPRAGRRHVIATYHWAGGW